MDHCIPEMIRIAIEGRGGKTGNISPIIHERMMEESLMV
jgi:hypothetical protein